MCKKEIYNSLMLQKHFILLANVVIINTYITIVTYKVEYIVYNNKILFILIILR